MSTTTETQAVETPVKNLRQTRKEAAAAKAPAKKSPAKAAETKAEKPAKEGKTFVYEATGRFGVTNRRSFPHEVAVAADVKDPSNPSPRWQGGLITRFFVSEDAAQRYVEKQRESGCDVILVPAKLVETK